MRLVVTEVIRIGGKLHHKLCRSKGYVYSHYIPQPGLKKLKILLLQPQ